MMRRFLNLVLASALLAGLLAGASAANITGTDTGEGTGTMTIKLVIPVIVTEVNLNTATASVKVGETVTLTATVKHNDSTAPAVTWNSSDTSVATVSDGVVSGVKAGGPVTITATAGDKSATCKVTVTGGSAGDTGGGGGGDTGDSSGDTGGGGDSGGSDITPTPEPEAEPENVSNPTPESLVPDMTDEQKSEAAGMAADALEASGNLEAAEEFRNTTPATADETKEAITQATPEEAQQAANNATEEMASQGREVRGEPVAIGTVVFEETRLVFLAIILPDSMQVGDLLTFFKNEQVSGNAVSLAAESSGAVVFLDSAGKETKVVPEDRKVTMATVFEGGKTYQPVIVATKAEEAETKESGSASSNSGCDAGFGAAGLSSIVLAAALATRRMR